MARTDSSVKPLTYAISYGFLGGPAHSRQLRKQLRKLGYTETINLERADIVIAHSAGCWLVPDGAKAKLLVDVGMVLAQASAHQTFRAAQRENIRAFIRHHHIWRGIKIVLCSFYYGLVQPLRNRNIVHGAKQAQSATELPGAQTVFIANGNDPWLHSEKLQSYLITRDWAFIGLPGSHNDIWEYSGRYAAIIDHYARLLA
ncbi:MAG TPA: hypothetical protein VII55_00275 [Candidatus Saccharimonadales bacterium]